MWRRYLEAGINLADYGAAPWDTHRLTSQDLRAIQAHHQTRTEASNG